MSVFQDLRRPNIPGSRRSALVLVAILALTGGLYLLLHAVFLRAEVDRGPNRAQFFAQTIDDSLDRLLHLPFVVSINPIVLDAIRRGDPTVLNRELDRIADRAGAEFVFLMDIDGQTIAASNYAEPDSLVGKYYTFRPYFRDAIAGRTGRFYAVGVTTGRPGYFIAEPVRDATGKVFGAVVVKVSLDGLNRTLSDSGALVLVTTEQGVVIASSRSDLIFGLTSPLSAFDRQTLEERRQFGDVPLRLLDWRALSDNRIELDGTSYLWTTAQVSSENWTVYLLSDLRGIRTRALLFVALITAGLLALTILATVFRSAQLRAALSVSNADRERLTQEIEDRRTAEARLGLAQKELARQNRLAALGQMSASITHELGQPISAMRNYIVSEEIAQDAVPGQLAPQLSGLVDRMQRIVDQLRFFGRKDRDVSVPFQLRSAVDGALDLLWHDAARIDVEIDITADGPVTAIGNQPTVEQVIVNLLRNAIDAVEGASERRIEIILDRFGSDARLRIKDTGPGLAGRDIGDLQEPFFTTKASGRGMGLGLAISAQIVNDMGGRIEASDRPDGGACFTVMLPSAGSEVPA